MKDKSMKKQYTKKQIVEAINYWKKQLRAGNYRKLDEELSLAQTNNAMGRYLLLTHNSDMFTMVFLFNDENLGKQACKNAMEIYVKPTDEDDGDAMVYQTDKDPSHYMLTTQDSDITRSTNLDDREYQPFTEIIDLINQGNYSCFFEDNGFEAGVIGKSISTDLLKTINDFYQKHFDEYGVDTSSIDNSTLSNIGLSDESLIALINSSIKSGKTTVFQMESLGDDIFQLVEKISPEIF